MKLKGGNYFVWGDVKKKFKPWKGVNLIVSLVECTDFCVVPQVQVFELLSISSSIQPRKKWQGNGFWLLVSNENSNNFFVYGKLRTNFPILQFNSVQLMK